MYKVISITPLFEKPLPLDKLDIMWVGEGQVLAKWKGSGFLRMYSSADCYTVITEKVEG